MTKIQNLNKKIIVGIILFLFLVLFFLQPGVFSPLFQTILGRTFLVILIVYITYCNQTWGLSLLFVLFLMMMYTNTNTVEGFDWEPSKDWKLDLKNYGLDLSNNYSLNSITKSLDPSNNYSLDSITKSLDPSNNYSFDFSNNNTKNETLLSSLNNTNDILTNLQKKIEEKAAKEIEAKEAQSTQTNDLKVATDTQYTKVKEIITSPSTSTVTQPKKILTCTENFETLEGFGFDLLELEDKMKRGIQSNLFQLGNLYNNNSFNVIPYEQSFFSPFHQ